MGEPRDRSAEGFYLIGICHREKGRLTDAVAAFEHAASLAPNLIPVREELSDLYATLGRRADELEELQLLASLDHDHVDRQVAVGLAHARAGHVELSVETLRTVFESHPEQLAIYGAIGRVWLEAAESRDDRGDLKKAVEALERVAFTPSATSEILTLYGRALILDGQPDAAERMLQQATERFPVEANAFLEYANVAERQNHFEAARHALLQYGTLVSDEDNTDTVYRDGLPRAFHIASLSLRLNEPVPALMWFERAIAASPDDLRILAGLAEAQFKNGDRPAAQATVARALEKDPTNASLVALSRRLR